MPGKRSETRHMLPVDAPTKNAALADRSLYPFLPLRIGGHLKSSVVGWLSRSASINDFAEFANTMLQIRFIKPVDRKFLKFVKKYIMLTKEKIIKSFDTLPDNLTIDQVIDRVIMLDKIEQGLKDVEDGNVYTTEEVKVKLNKWLQ